MTVAEETKADKAESRQFQADVAKLLHLMVHSVYSDKSVFLRELIANAADACERLRYEAIADPALLGDDAKPRITVALDADKKLCVEDNGIGMSREEMIEALGTIARSGTKAFLERIEADQKEGEGEGSALIGRFGVGFYSAFMVAERVDVISRRAGTDAAWLWSSDGKGTFDIAPVTDVKAAHRGTRVVLHLMDEAKTIRRARHRRALDQGAVGPRAGADRDRGQARRGAGRDHRRRRFMGQAESRHHARPITPTSTAALRWHSTSRR